MSEERGFDNMEEREHRPPKPVKKGFYRKYVILGLAAGILVYGGLLGAVLASIIFIIVDSIISKEKSGFTHAFIAVLIAMLVSGIIMIIFESVSTTIAHVDFNAMNPALRWVLFGQMGQ